MFENILALVLDVDGTLINDHKEIGSRTKKAIQEFQLKHDCRVVLASSRMPRSLRIIGEELKVKCDFVCYDGALCFSKSISSHNCVLDLNVSGYDRLALSDLVALDEFFVSVFVGDHWFCSRDGYWLDREIRGNKIQPDAVSISKVKDHLLEGLPFHKFMLRGEHQSVTSVALRLRRILGGSANLYSNKETILEIVSSDSSKALGTKAVLDCPEKQLLGVIAFGDGHNDLDLMKEAEHAVAMLNSAPEVLKSAKHRTLSNNEEGVAVFLEGLLR